MGEWFERRTHLASPAISAASPGEWSSATSSSRARVFAPPPLARVPPTGWQSRRGWTGHLLEEMSHEPRPGTYRKEGIRNRKRRSLASSWRTGKGLVSTYVTCVANHDRRISGTAATKGSPSARYMKGFRSNSGSPSNALQIERADLYRARVGGKRSEKKKPLCLALKHWKSLSIWCNHISCKYFHFCILFVHFKCKKVLKICSFYWLNKYFLRIMYWCIL